MGKKWTCPFAFIFAFSICFYFASILLFAWKKKHVK